MLNVSDATKLAYQKDGNIKNYKIIFPELKDSDNKELTFTNPQIVAESLQIKEGIQSGDSLDFTGCLSSTAEFELAKTDYDFKDKIVKIYVQIDGTDEIPLFYGKVDKVTKEGAFSMTKKINAYDLMYKFDEKDATEWYHSLSYPMTYKQFRDSFWKKFGLVENADDNQQDCTLMNDDIVIEKKQLSDDSTLTAASVIKAICQVNVCYGIFNREGKFRYVTLEGITEALYPATNLYPDTVLYPAAENESATITPISRIIDIKYDDYKTKEIVGVGIVDDSAYMTDKDGNENSEDKSFIGKAGSVGKDDNRFVIETNFLTYGLGGTPAQTMCEKILEYMKKIIYIGIDIKIKGLPYTEVGDIIVMEGAGDVIHSYVLSRTLTGTSDLQDSVTAKGENLNTPIISIDELINSEIFRRKIGNDHLYSLIEQTSSSITLEIQNVDKQLRTAIDMTDGKIVAEVERAQNSETAITTRVTLTETELSLHAGEISTLSQNLNVVSQNVNLKANKVDVDASIVSINGSLNAHSASINDLYTKKLSTANLSSAISELTKINCTNITASDGNFSSGLGVTNPELKGTVKILGNNVSWKSQTVMTSPQTSTTIHYLGY